MSGGDTRFVFLRAINTGSRRLTNDELLQPLRDAGLADVMAYQAAGNLVLRTEPGQAVDEDTLDALLGEAYGFDCPTFVRTLEELRSIVDDQPFTTSQLAATEGRVQVTFLRAAPDRDAVDAVASLVPDEDLVVVCPSHWYWLPRTGVSGSSLSVTAFERVLGPMTMRTLGTIERMLAKFGG